MGIKMDQSAAPAKMRRRGILTGVFSTLAAHAAHGSVLSVGNGSVLNAGNGAGLAAVGSGGGGGGLQLVHAATTIATNDWLPVVITPTSGTMPSGITASWSSGGSATVSNFTLNSDGLTAYAYVRSPASAASSNVLTLTGTGPNTGSTTVTINVVTGANDLPATISGPPTVYGPSAPQVWAAGTLSTNLIGNYLPRGFHGPVTVTLSGTDAQYFAIGQGPLFWQTQYSGLIDQYGYGFALILQPIYFQNGIGYSLPDGHLFNITLTFTDGISTVVLNPTPTLFGASVSCVQLFGNTVLDTSPTHDTGSYVVVGAMVGPSLTAVTLTDPSGLFSIYANSFLVIQQSSLIAANFGVHPVTFGGTGVRSYTVNIYLGHEFPTKTQWVPNGKTYSTLQPRNLSLNSPQPSLMVGQLISYNDTGNYHFNYTTNPGGVLQTWFDGETYVTTPPTVGTLTASVSCTSFTGLTVANALNLPVIAGTTLPAGDMTAVVTSGLTNFVLSANTFFIASAYSVPKVTVATITLTTMTTIAQTILNVVGDTCQNTVDELGGAKVPRYAITWSGSSGAWTGTVTAWNLSAQTDQLQITVFDGNGSVCSNTFNITATWATSTYTSVTVGPGGTFTTMGAFVSQLWSGYTTPTSSAFMASQYAGCTATLLPGLSMATADWVPSLPPGVSYQNWIPCPINWVGTLVSGEQLLLNASGHALNGSSQGLFVAGGGYDQNFSYIIFNGVSNGGSAAAVYKVHNTAGNLKFNYCCFFNCDNGIINASAGDRYTLTYCQFARNGNQAGSGHNMYFGEGAIVTFTNGDTFDTWIGHEFKSRMNITAITNSNLWQGINGTGSSILDLPEGGTVTVSGCSFVISAGSNNTASFAIGWCPEINNPNFAAWPNLTLNVTTSNITNQDVRSLTDNLLGMLSYYPYNFVSLQPPAATFTGVTFWGLTSGQYGGTSSNGVPATFPGCSTVTSLPNPNMALINRLTGNPFINGPNPACYAGVPGAGVPSIAGPYPDMRLVLPTGPASGTAVQGNHTGSAYTFTAYDASGTPLTGTVTWAFIPGYANNNANFTLVSSGATCQLHTVGALANGTYGVCFQATGTGTLPGGGTGTITTGQFGTPQAWAITIG